MALANLLFLLALGTAAWAQPAAPDYDRDNPILNLTARARGVSLSGGEQGYAADSLAWLFPVTAFGLPSENPAIAHDGRASTQEALRTYQLGAYFAVKGLLNFGGGHRNFLKIGHSGAGLSASRDRPVTLEIKANSRSARVAMQFDPAEAAWSVELWALPRVAAASLSPAVKRAVEAGRVVLDEQLLPGNPLDYQPSRIKGTVWETGHPDDINHPLRAATLTLTFTGPSGQQDGPHVVAFKMIRRGFDNFRSDRWSNNPHGGTGSIESSVFYLAESEDPDRIERRVAPGAPLASGEPAKAATVERFFTAKYMQYVRFGPSASIGIHRHKNYFDAFWVTRGSGMGVVIDAVPLDGSEPTAELRRMRAFQGMIVRPGQMHGLLRDTEEPLEMFAMGAAN